MTTVLVTGVGAVTGYGILRELRARRPEVRLVGTDIHDDAVGAQWCDLFLPCPAAADTGYLDWLRDAVTRERVDLVFPTLDADLDAFQSAGTCSAEDSPVSAVVALNSDTAIAVSRDKWALDRCLVDHSEPVRIPTSTSSDFDELASTLGLPFLLKLRRGYGARGIVTVTERADFTPHAPRLADELVAQQAVGDDDEEYTVGAFGDGTGRVCARVAMRRELSEAGSTRRGEVFAVPPDLDATIGRIARIVDARGPTNLQFRRTGDGWSLLEINARVSSSTSMRALFGYHEAEMTVDHYLTGSVPTQPPIRPGTAVRYLEDLVIE